MTQNYIIQDTIKITPEHERLFHIADISEENKAMIDDRLRHREKVRGILASDPLTVSEEDRMLVINYYKQHKETKRKLGDFSDEGMDFIYNAFYKTHGISTRIMRLSTNPISYIVYILSSTSVDKADKAARLVRSERPELVFAVMTKRYL